MTSLVVTLVPLTSLASDYFTIALRYPTLFRRAPDIDKRDFIGLARRTGRFLELPAPQSLAEALDVMTEAFPDRRVEAVFGYYGETSVCLPRIFPARGAPGWEWTIFLTSMNLALFLFIAVGYGLIYAKAARVKSVTKDETAAMQGRFTSFSYLVSQLDIQAKKFLQHWAAYKKL